MTRLMPRKSALVFAAFVISLASGSVLAQDVQLIEFKPKKTLTLRDLPRLKQIAHGGCCAHVGWLHLVVQQDRGLYRQRRLRRQPELSPLNRQRGRSLRWARPLC